MTTISSPAGIELSPQPVWQEQATNTGVTLINETDMEVTFIGNGMLTLPDTGETIIVANNGTLLGSSVTRSAYRREAVRTEDGETSTIIFYEIVQSNPATRQEKGIITAVFDRNATGTFASFNGMVLAGIAGIYDVLSNTEEAIITLWDWESGIGNSGVAPPLREWSQMNITITTSEIQQANMP